MKKLLTILFSLLLITLLFDAVQDDALAQSRHITSQSYGLGGGGTAYQDLYHANFINPANLMLNNERRPKFTIGIAGGISSQTGGSLVNISTYNEFLTTGLVIEGQVADDMLNQWFGGNSADMSNLGTEIGIIPLGAAWRSDKWAVSVASRARVIGNSGFSRGFADLVFRGLDPDIFGTGRAVNSSQEYAVFNEISVGYGRTIMEMDDFLGFAKSAKLHIGAAPKMLMAYNYFDVSLNSMLTVNGSTSESNASINHDFEYTIRSVGELSDQLAEYNQQRAAGGDASFSDVVSYDGSDMGSSKGTSFGIDLGATLEMDISNLSVFDMGFFRGNKKLLVGLSLTDLGSLSFNEGARSFVAAENFTWHGFNYDREMIEEEFDGDNNKYFESVLRDSIGSDVYGNFSTREESGFSVGLPTTLNFGSHLMLGKFSLMMDVGAGIVERGINSKGLHMALGSEYRIINRIPVRVGIRTGGYSATTYHAGTGLELRNFEFSVGAGSTRNSQNGGGSAGFAWSGLVLHF